MPRALRILLMVTDLGFVAYWAISGGMAFGLLSVPPEWLFRDYHDPQIVAWNWSFMPIDLLASTTGILALWAARHARDWQPLALVSMTLTFCAGLLALSFWAFQCSFDPAWWLSNLFLVAWPAALFVSSRGRYFAAVASV
ncbi:MAG: DUF5360 family protein [Polyangiaceae bacterium]